MLTNTLTELLRIEYPIIQAPMGGGVTTSKLVAEVSNAGGLGMIGAGYLNPHQAREQIREIKQLTANPFGINLFVPEEFDVLEGEVSSANQALQPIRNHLNLPPKDRFEFPAIENVHEAFADHIQVLIEEKVPICSFTFGIPSKDIIAELKRHNVFLIGTATTVEEAIENEKFGMDAVVVQGSEAGGHRGSFMDGNQEKLIGLMSLIPQTVDEVSIPVIAAGGIMDARGLMASICLGAKGVQMGTAFLTCLESGAHETHIAAILNAHEDQTVLTRAFSGKWARGIENRFTSEMRRHERFLPDFPIQNVMTQDIRKSSAIQTTPEFMSLWSGQSPRLAKNQTVQELIQNVMEDVKRINSNL